MVPPQVAHRPAGLPGVGWETFPHKAYYPHCFEPYWRELLVVPVWSLKIVLGFSHPIQRSQQCPPAAR